PGGAEQGDGAFVSGGQQLFSSRSYEGTGMAPKFTGGSDEHRQPIVFRPVFQVRNRKQLLGHQIGLISMPDVVDEEKRGVQQRLQFRLSRRGLLNPIYRGLIKA